ncbi:hypothetical protein [Streptomyces abyssomicinicus]|uniref:hypothetical protein n=1 Tax=Streptomyces abyssomicinicus TaxID=574929 RepID=UPI00124FF0EC|nr:hypothetical protein [Streptomyces abyssomicinicus]
MAGGQAGAADDGPPIRVVVEDAEERSLRRELRDGELCPPSKGPGDRRTWRFRWGLAVEAHEDASVWRPLAGADGEPSRPLPGLPEARKQWDADHLGVSDDGTVVAVARCQEFLTEPEGAATPVDWDELYLLPPGASSWQHLPTPGTVRLWGTVGREAGALLLAGVVRERKQARTGTRPALFALRTADRQLTEVPVGEFRERRHWRDPLRLYRYRPEWAVPRVGDLHLRDGLLAYSGSTETVDLYVWDDIHRLYVIDLRGGEASTAQLGLGRKVLDLRVGADRVVRAVTDRHLYLHRPGRGWRRKRLRPLLGRLVEVHGRPDVRSVSITDDQILVSLRGAVVSLALDGTPGEVVYRWPEEVRDLRLLEGQPD